ncbi:MAG: alpha-hydroxy-acid oxidizing protein [Chloroflexi bacterium]|nr:alpha-hydroxy-acid oxidizing protein [Chloroflexota bacterium]
MESGPVNLYEYEALAKERLPKPEWDFIEGGATDEITIGRTRRAFDSIMLRPRMLVDMDERDLSTTVLGEKLDFPVMLCPAGHHIRAHPDAEKATVRAASAMDVGMILSSGSSVVMEDVAANATRKIWFQQYFYRDQGITELMAHRAEESGFSALCITLDASIRSKRERNLRNNYMIPASPNYDGLEVQRGFAPSSDDAPPQFSGMVSPRATWKDFEWLAGKTELPLVAKGVMTAEDARLAVEHGVKAIIVSNHGGRSLDSTFATIEVLPEVVDAVDGRAEVYLDGGIRRGTDIVKALALGARAVLIGRPIFWGLAAGGEEGLRGVLTILRDELESTMGLCGIPEVGAIGRNLVGGVSPLMSLTAD